MIFLIMEMKTIKPVEDVLKLAGVLSSKVQKGEK